MEALHIWRRRWILTAFLLVMVVIGTGVAVVKVPRTYQAESTVILLASRNASKSTGGGNPYLSFSDSLSTTAGVVESEVTEPQIASSLKARGYPESYEVASQSTLSNTTLLPAPFLLVTVSGHNKDLVEHTLYGVTNEIGYVLRALQSSVSRNNQISSFVASFDPQPTLSVTSTARSLVVVLGVLIVLALGIPLVVDAGSARTGESSRTNSRPSSPETGKGPVVAAHKDDGHVRHNARLASPQPTSVVADHQREPYYSERESHERSVRSYPPPQGRAFD